MKVRSRAIGAALLAWLLAVALSGCGPFTVPMGLGPMAIRGNGETLEFALCESMKVDEIRAKARPADGSSNWETYWEGTGFLSMGRGDPITYELLQANFVLDDARPLPRSPGQIAITVKGAPPYGNLIGFITIGPDGLSDTLWLHPNDILTSEPCV